MEKIQSRDIYSTISQFLPVNDVNKLRADPLIPIGMRLATTRSIIECQMGQKGGLFCNDMPTDYCDETLSIPLSGFLTAIFADHNDEVLSRVVEIQGLKLILPPSSTDAPAQWLEMSDSPTIHPHNPLNKPPATLATQIVEHELRNNFVTHTPLLELRLGLCFEGGIPEWGYAHMGISQMDFQRGIVAQTARLCDNLISSSPFPTHVGKPIFYDLRSQKLCLICISLWDPACPERLIKNYLTRRMSFNNPYPPPSFKGVRLTRFLRKKKNRDSPPAQFIID